jgi:hypothetical protein
MQVIIVACKVGNWPRAEKMWLGSQLQKEGREAGKNYQGSAVRKGARGPTELNMFLSLSIVQLLAACTNQTFQTMPKSLWSWQPLYPIQCTDF